MLPYRLGEIDQVMLIDGKCVLPIVWWRQRYTRHHIQRRVKTLLEWDTHLLLEVFQTARALKFKGQIYPTICQQPLIDTPQARIANKRADHLEVFIELHIFFVDVIG